jgi:hypothetical protein
LALLIPPPKTKTPHLAQAKITEHQFFIGLWLVGVLVEAIFSVFFTEPDILGAALF